MQRALTDRLWRWAPLAVVAALAGLYLASTLGAPLPRSWVPPGETILLLGFLLLVFQATPYAQQRALTEAVEQLLEENARLKAEAARSAREAEQVRERLEAEVRSLRLAFEELRREQFARSPSQAG
jgi:hypothetical protein